MTELRANHERYQQLKEQLMGNNSFVIINENDPLWIEYNKLTMFFQRLQNLSPYYGKIEASLKKFGRPELDPRHIEAYMRLAHDALSGLTPHQWEEEVMIGIGCIDLEGIMTAERLADSYGI